MSEVVVARQFCGPPNSGNGGYVSGLLAQSIPGAATAVLRAIIPLDTTLQLIGDAAAATLSGEGGALIGEAKASAGETLTIPPAPPTFEQAEAAGKRYFAFSRRFHPICFTCGPERAEGDGARVFVGPIEGAPAGHVAGVWSAAPGFCGPDGLARTEIVWAALDCPGSIAWVERQGSGGGLLGTMTAEILRRPAQDEPVIITAWPIEQDGRKQFAGVAMFSRDGELMARAHQVWISMKPREGA